MGVSSRGNAESVLAALVLGTLLCMEGTSKLFKMMYMLLISEVKQVLSFSAFYLFSSSSSSDVGSHTLWTVCPHEDLPHYICSAHRPKPAYTRNQIWWGQKEVDVEELCWIYRKLPQPKAVTLCKCGRRSLLYAHSTLLLHVRWRMKMHTEKKVFIACHCFCCLCLISVKHCS